MTRDELRAKATAIAKAVSDAWPNGYSHRDHFPKAVAIIEPFLADAEAALAECEREKAKMKLIVEKAKLVVDDPAGWGVSELRKALAALTEAGEGEKKK